MSYSISLTKQKEKHLRGLLKTTEQSKILKRYQCIHFKRQGLPNNQIAALLCVHIDTITDWLKLFCSEGLEGLGELSYDGRRTSQLEEYKEDIKAYVDENIVSSIKELQSYISETYNLTIEHSWLFRYCKKNSIYLTKRPKAILQK